MSPNGKEMVKSLHKKGGQCSPCPSAAATTSNGKDKATHTDDETRKSSSEDGTRAMESFQDGFRRTNRRVIIGEEPLTLASQAHRCG
jgi:hypothetical protein